MPLTRARITERLAQATRLPIALVVAPAGFGKSVAVRDFLRQASIAAVRFDVRREDNSLLAFARRLSEVLAPLAADAVAAFPAVQERVLSSAEPHRLLADWFARYLGAAEGTVVVDDLHFATADPLAVAFLVELVDRTCARIRWLLVTRSDAGLPVASWLAYGRMVVPLGESELRFTADEARAAAAADAGDIAPSEIAALCELTDGWPVALALAMRTGTQAAALRVAATRDLIYRYLAEQVYEGLTDQQRAFLLATSIFPSFDASMARALQGTPEFLNELQHGVGFLTQSSSGSYRYHDLFRDFLESVLARSPGQRLEETLRDGARMLEQRGDVAGALKLYARARDVPSIAKILETAGFGLFERGHSDVLAMALEALPENVRRIDATALGLQAALEGARGNAELAAGGFVAAIAQAHRDDVRLELVHRYAIELVRQDRDCTALLEDHVRDAGVLPALRAPLLGTLATAYARASRVGEALESIGRALELTDPSMRDDVRARLYQQAAYVYVQGPDHETARWYATLAVELALARNLYDVAARAYSVLYQLAYDDADDLKACLSILERLVDCAHRSGSEQIRLYGLMARYGIEADRGSDAELERIESQLAYSPGTLPQNRAEVVLPMALRIAWRGEFGRAYALLAQTTPFASDERRAEQSALAALYASAAGMHDEALRAHEASLAALESLRRATRRSLRTRLILAMFELVRGRSTSAHRQLAEVKRDVGAGSGRLGALYAAVVAYYHRTLNQCDDRHRQAALDRLQSEDFGGLARLLEVLPFAHESASGGYATLTTTEREVLRWLVAGASSKEIAARMARSPRTVDTHVRAICKKLHCQGRRSAIALATSSGWVQTDAYRAFD